MKVVIAPDSFKGSLTAALAARAIERGVRAALPRAVTVLKPMADGGEGTLDALVSALGGERLHLEVQDPLGRPVRAAYGRCGQLAVIELAAASGLPLLTGAERDPLRSDSFGTGQLMRAALEGGAHELLVCLGGSATVDGGSGLLRALGFRFLDARGQPLPPGGAALLDLAQIDDLQVPPAVRTARVRVACDVTNPLLGPQGASAVFAPQKGAGPREVALLEAALARFAQVLEAHARRPVRNQPGAGAAGGAAAGLVGLLRATLEPGAALVADAIHLDAALESADLVISGEGRLDAQTASGKVVAEVGRRARARAVPCLALAGSVTGDLGDLHALGLSAALSLARGPARQEELMRAAEPLLEAAAEQAVRLFVSARPR
ncbi:glycerate kinase [Deinobacterium chartae]|uniref:Glycerate kinase n=1 Tax=Deinobacterium chartae TaxID=521158 RepID=A0A841HYY2_9DEIO|nr:glycerate kinase [Deinobacterium chartae]